MSPWSLITLLLGGLCSAAVANPPAGDAFEQLGTIAAAGGTWLSTLAAVPSALIGGVRGVWFTGRTSDDESVFPVGTGPDVTANGGLDTVVVRVQIGDDPWTDLGFAKPGTHGAAALTGSGTLGPLSPVGLALTNALENTTAWLAFGVAALYAPFMGGTLVPDISIPGVLLPVPTDALGEATLTTTVPPGLPAGFTLYFQFWFADAGAAGPPAAASNALSAVTP